MLGAAQSGLGSAVTIILIISGILGLAGLGGAAFGIFRTNLSKSTIDALKEYNDVLEKQNKILEEQKKECEHDIEVLKVRVNKLEDENAVLKERVDAKTLLETVVTDTTRILHILQRGDANGGRS